MTELENIVHEFDRSFEDSRQAAEHRPWAHPARLPEHPETRSDRHPDDPEHFEMFMTYF